MTPLIDEINRFLSDIMKMRWVFLFILFSLFPILVLTMVYVERFKTWYPIIFPVFLFFLGMIIQDKLHKKKCPKCNSFFFMQTGSKDKYTPASSISFPPQKNVKTVGLLCTVKSQVFNNFPQSFLSRRGSDAVRNL